MGRSAAIVPEKEERGAEVTNLDDEIALILRAIEEEAVPQRLTTLALELQQALVQRTRRQNPN
ncbi:MAG TPA: hypothetical protein VNS34_08745 [Rhizobiaceae bacterium]|nr:hypothetical protein [Rhizobiaceae bacterium]